MKSFWLLFVLMFTQLGFAQDVVTISGYIKDQKEKLLYAKIFIPELEKGVISDENGFYTIEVPKKDHYTFVISYLNYKKVNKIVPALESSSVDLLLSSSAKVLDKVEVNAVRSQEKEDLESTEVSVVRLNIRQAKLLPSIGGETDVLKIAQLLPGITRGAEGTTDFFVRGGDGDQNLIIIDDATVYNPGHLFGFFSVFNPDVVEEIKIYKGGFPANYGGRLSSITDIRVKDGDAQKFRIEGGVGLLSSRITIEAPVWKNRLSVLVSGRRTYIDRVVSAVSDQELPYYFFDLNGKIDFKAGKKDRILLSSYYGDDVLDVADNGDGDSTNAFGFGFNLGNFTQTLRWNHIYNPKFFSNLSLTHTRFQYNIRGNFPGNQLLIQSSVRDFGAKYAFTYLKTDKTQIKFGTELINHNFRPNVVTTSGDISQFLASTEGELDQTFEGAIYGNVEHSFTPSVKFNGGLRLSGSAPQNAFYGGIEPRANLTYIFQENQSLKFSYARTTQYLHRVSSSTATLPTDLWYPISENIRPQSADQIAGAYNLYIPKINTSLIIEGYGKLLRGLTEYKEGSNLILNNEFEELLLQGRGWSYGTELLLKREYGRLSGWLGYTLSWTKRQFDELNNGEPFFATYDRRNYLTAVGTFEITPRVIFSAIFEFANGSRFTPIIGQFAQPNPGLTGIEIVPIFAERNSFRLSASHRLDVNLVLRSKPEKKFQTEWHIGAYNVYNRTTPFQVQIVEGEDGALKYTQPGLFGFIPSVAFNFRF